MSDLYILIGLPGSGKTTWRNSFINAELFNFTVPVSSDDFIERIAEDTGVSYAEAFKEIASDGSAHAENDFQDALRSYSDIIVDRTNLTPKSRKKWLSRAHNYRKIAVVFEVHDDERERRNASRKEGRVIPEHVIQSMKETYIPPTREEGFDEIRYIYS